jgi:hypothetical protein
MDEFISVSFLISKVKDNHRNSCEVMAFKKLIGYVVFELKSKIFFKKRGKILRGYHKKEATDLTR